jgi:hypothetical protein
VSKTKKQSTVNLADFMAADDEKFQIRVEQGGKTFVISPAHILPDDRYQELVALDDDDIVGIARVSIDDYDGFVAAGGRAWAVHKILKAAVEGTLAEQEASPGESEASEVS